MALGLFAPIPYAVAVLFVAAPLIGAIGASMLNRGVDQAPVLVSAAAASKAAKPAPQGVVHQIVLKTGMAGGKMVYFDAKGGVNPTLRANVGDIVEITLSSGEGAEHDIVITELNVKSKLFDGSVGALTKEHKMVARVGETVRVYFGVGGPNKISSFHVIGEIFDKVYSEASLRTVKADVQTTLVPAGGATIVEFKLDYPGKYLLVDHALSRAGKGLVGALEVSGPANAKVYKPSHPLAAGGAH